MQYTSIYKSPLGGILLAGDENGLTGLWFDGGKYYGAGLSGGHEAKELPLFAEVKRWLDVYFDGREPDFTPPLHLTGSDFQLAVWGLLREIPYGKTTTYGKIAEALAAKAGLTHMSAQAVGGAVGHNPISVILPCHRVIGAGGSLTGYAGGIEKKRKLLALEGVDTRALTVPKKGSAL